MEKFHVEKETQTERSSTPQHQESWPMKSTSGEHGTLPQNIVCIGGLTIRFAVNGICSSQNSVDHSIQ